MTWPAGAAHRSAAVLSAIFFVAAAVFASRYLQASGGWNIEEASNDQLTIALLVLGGVLATAVAILRPGRQNREGARLTAKDSDIQQRLGLTVFDLIVASAGLLFAVILDLNSIRNAIGSQQLTYLEWFPLILIVFIVLVVLNAVLRGQEWRLPLLGYSGDLVPVLAYWPALIGTLLTVTLLVFFY